MYHLIMLQNQEVTSKWAEWTWETESTHNFDIPDLLLCSLSLVISLALSYILSVRCLRARSTSPTSKLCSRENTKSENQTAEANIVNNLEYHFDRVFCILTFNFKK